MSISEKDLEFMARVAAYYLGGGTIETPKESIRSTAQHFNINRNKVRKILITAGVIESSISEDARSLRAQGLSVKDIAIALGVSVATVSTAIPYEDKIDNSLDPSAHAAEVREYRAYERTRKNRQAGETQKKDRIEWNDRRSSGPSKVIHLHMELLMDDMDDDSIKILKTYGKLEHGNNISRDMLVPADMPLYAIHYAIQRAFGWENSHLHQFEVTPERFRALCNNNVSMWSCLVGVLFRSPFMDMEEEFWADDYKGGSFKNWLRSKYTGPYMSLCHGEGLIPCQNDMMQLDMKEKYYVAYAKAFNSLTGKYDGAEVVASVYPIYDPNGKKRPEPKPWHPESEPYRVEITELAKVPADGISFLSDRPVSALLERLPIGSVLAIGKDTLPDDCTEEEKAFIREQMMDNGNEVYGYAKKHIRRIVKDYVDAPEIQVPTMPFTDEVIYEYDSGDGWRVRITGSESAEDLVRSGRISEKTLIKAVDKCHTLYRPVLIAGDGEMLMDDVGGVEGFAEFLEVIHPQVDKMTKNEREAAERKKEEYLEWARGQGWHREKVSDFNLM